MKKIIVREISGEFKNYAIEIVEGENRSVICRINEMEIAEDHGNSYLWAQLISRVCSEFADVINVFEFSNIQK